MQSQSIIKEVKPSHELISMPDDQSQHAILGALEEYCRKNKYHSKKLKRQLRSGLCAGLSSLMFYAHWLEPQPKRVDSTGKPILRDDLTWVKTVIQKLLFWDKKSPFPPDLDVERLISHIQFFYEDPFQHHSGFKREILHTDTRGRTFRKEYTLPVRLTKNDFSKTLFLNNEKTTLLDAIVHEEKMTFIGASRHATFITKRNDNYYLYDPNNKKGMLTFSKNSPHQVQEFIDLILKSHWKYGGSYSLFTYVIFGINEPEKKLDDTQEHKQENTYQYPRKDELFEQLDFMLQNRFDERIALKPADLLKILTPEERAELGYFSHDALKLPLSRFIHDFIPQHLQGKMIEHLGCRQNRIEEFKEEDRMEALGDADFTGDTLLQEAARMGDLDTVKMCLKKGLSVKNKKGCKALLYALLASEESVAVELLAAGATLKESYQVPMLLVFAIEGHPRMIELMLKSGIDVNKKYWGISALMEAARNGHSDCVSTLLKANANIHAQSWFDDTALIFATIEGHVDIVQQLIKEGALVNGKDYTGRTALIYAVEKGHARVVKALIAAGANDLVKNTEGHSLISVAAKEHHNEVLSVLLSNGAYADEKNSQGETVLFETVRANNIDGMTILLLERANINARNKELKSPLFYALEEKNICMLDALLEQGAQVNILDAHGKTPLFYALNAEPIEMDVIKTLIKAGANTTLTELPSPPPLLCALRKFREANFNELMGVLNAKLTLSYSLKKDEAGFVRVDRVINNLCKMNYTGKDAFILKSIKTIHNTIASAYQIFFQIGSFDLAWQFLLMGYTDSSASEAKETKEVKEVRGSENPGIVAVLNRAKAHHKQTNALRFLGSLQPMGVLEKMLTKALVDSNLELHALANGEVEVMEAKKMLAPRI